MENILVVFGGKSVEREISVLTGVLTLNALDKDLVYVQITKNDPRGPEGIVIDVSEIQDSNTDVPIFFNPFGNWIVFIFWKL